MFKGLIFNIANEGYANRYPGAHRIATELRKNDWDIEVIDFVHWWSFDQLKSLLISRIDQDTKFIGISSVFSVWPECCESICQWLKENHPDITIIYGSGTFKTLKTRCLDYYLVGYGETTTIKLMKHLFSNGESLRYQTIKGIKVIKTEGAAPWRDPLIIYEDRDFIQPFEWLGIEFSRGCKFSCAYCNFPNIGVKGDWTRDAVSVERHLKDAYDRFGVTRYTVSDETFNDSIEKISKFADVMDNLNFEPFFTGFVRADLMASRGLEEWEQLARMKFYGHFYGIETFNHKTGKAIGKGMDPEKLQQGLIDIKNYFLNQDKGLYRGTIALVAGLPYESEESMQSSFDWLTKNWIGESYLFNLLEIPVKDVYENLNGNSKMTMDFEKFGYTKISESDNITTMMSRDSGVVWKNEHTDIYRMYDFVEKLYDEVGNYDFRLNNWEISYANSNASISEILNYDQKVNVGDWIKHCVKEYIEKKLSYK